MRTSHSSHSFLEVCCCCCCFSRLLKISFFTKEKNELLEKKKVPGKISTLQYQFRRQIFFVIYLTQSLWIIIFNEAISIKEKFLFTDNWSSMTEAEGKRVERRMIRTHTHTRAHKFIWIFIATYRKMSMSLIEELSCWDVCMMIVVVVVVSSSSPSLGLNKKCMKRDRYSLFFSLSLIFLSNGRSLILSLSLVFDFSLFCSTSSFFTIQLIVD